MRKLTWGDVKILVDKEVADDEVIGVMEYLGEPYIIKTLTAKEKEVEIYGTYESPESR